MKHALALIVLAACGGGGDNAGGGGAMSPDGPPSPEFDYTATVAVDTSPTPDAPPIASFTIDGTTYAAGETATVHRTFASFADSQVGIAVIATTTSGDQLTFTFTPTTCGGDDCSEPTGETCANLAAESEQWIFHTGVSALAPGSDDGSAAGFTLSPEEGTCDYRDGQHIGWAA